MLDRANLARAALHELAGTRGGTVLIAASMTIASYWLPRRLAAFHTLDSDVRLTVVIRNTNDVETQTGKQSLGQDDSVSQLSSLNSKLEQLISINHQLANINNDQLRVQKGFSFGDMFKSPV